MFLSHVFRAKDLEEQCSSFNKTPPFIAIQVFYIVNYEKEATIFLVGAWNENMKFSRALIYYPRYLGQSRNWAVKHINQVRSLFREKIV